MGIAWSSGRSKFEFVCEKEAVRIRLPSPDALYNAPAEDVFVVDKETIHLPEHFHNELHFNGIFVGRKYVGFEDKTIGLLLSATVVILKRTLSANSVLFTQIITATPDVVAIWEMKYWDFDNQGLLIPGTQKEIVFQNLENPSIIT